MRKLYRELDHVITRRYPVLLAGAPCTREARTQQCRQRRHGAPPESGVHEPPVERSNDDFRQTAHAPSGPPEPFPRPPRVLLSEDKIDLLSGERQQQASKIVREQHIHGQCNVVKAGRASKVGHAGCPSPTNDPFTSKMTGSGCKTPGPLSARASKSGDADADTQVLEAKLPLN